MNITRKDLLFFVLRLVPLVSILFMLTDMVGTLFVGDDYMVRAWFRWKVILFLMTFSTAFLMGSYVLKWPVRQMAYIGYPAYLLVMALCGVFTTPHDLLGYKIALVLAPLMAQVLKDHGKGWLRQYLRLVSRLAGGRLMGSKGLLLMLCSLSVVVLLITGA